MKEYSLKFSQKDEVLAGNPSKAHFIIINKGPARIASIKYEMVGRTLKVWNQTVGKGIEVRRKVNADFAAHLENTDKRTLGAELLMLAIARENPLGITTPHSTASSKRSMSRIGKKYGLHWNNPVPKGLKPLIPIKHRVR
jgi:hypothetical protein